MAPSTRGRSKSSKISSEDLLATIHELKEADLLPQLLVFDLDNTIWTPELYELYRKPTANRDIQLFPDVHVILTALHSCARHNLPMQYAIASRASESDWAHDLLDQFRINGNTTPLRELFPDRSLIHVVCRSKRWHFERIQQSSSVDYSDMIFYDDAYYNLSEVSSMGVFCCHTPRGLTVESFQTSLREFAKLKQQNEDMGQVMKHYG